MIAHSITGEGSLYLYKSGFIYDVWNMNRDRLLFCIQSPTALSVADINRICLGQTYDPVTLGRIEYFDTVVYNTAYEG